MPELLGEPIVVDQHGVERVDAALGEKLPEPMLANALPEGPLVEPQDRTDAIPLCDRLIVEEELRPRAGDRDRGAELSHCVWVVDAEDLNVRDPTFHDALRMHEPEGRPRSVGADLDFDRGIAHVAAVKSERRDQEVDPSLDAVAVIEEHNTSERRVVIEGRNA